MAPQTDVNPRLGVAIGLLTLLLTFLTFAAGLIARHLSNVSKRFEEQSERMAKIDKAHIDRYHELQLELREVSAELKALRAHHLPPPDEST